MRITKRSKIKWKSFVLGLFFIIPMGYWGVYGYKVSQLSSDLYDFQYEIPPNSSNFIKANYEVLGNMADVYDDLFQKNHMPLNFTTPCVYTNINYTEVEYYDYTDNG